MRRLMLDTRCYRGRGAAIAYFRHAMLLIRWLAYDTLMFYADAAALRRC